MPIYDGIVAFDDVRIPVIVGIEEDLVRLSADGKEIGVWSGDECSISYKGDGVFTIHAENETLRFLPREPDSFAAAVNGNLATASTTGEDRDNTEDSDQEWREAPAPKRTTRLLFYLLSTMTALLGAWAAIKLFF